MARQPAFRLEGDRALSATLAELGRTFGGAALDQAINSGMRTFHRSAQAKLRAQGSVSPGPRSWKGWNIAKGGKHLWQSMRVRKTLGRPRNEPEFRLGFVGRGRGVAHLVEFGTAPHYQPNLRFRHPGARPFPFMRPTFDVHGPKVIEDIMVQMRNNIMVQAAKLRQRYGGVKRP